MSGPVGARPPGAGPPRAGTAAEGRAGAVPGRLASPICPFFFPAPGLSFGHSHEDSAAHQCRPDLQMSSVPELSQPCGQLVLGFLLHVENSNPP